MPPTGRGRIRRHLFRRRFPTIRLEWLRHTGASLADAAYREMKAVAARLGQSSTRMMDAVCVELYEETGWELAAAIDTLALGLGRRHRGRDFVGDSLV